MLCGFFENITAPNIYEMLIQKFFAIVYLMSGQKYYGVSIDNAVML